MWFKNIRIYNITEALDLTDLESPLERHAKQPLSQMQESNFGFVPAFKDSNLLADSVDNGVFVCGMVEEKILPASVVNDALAEKLDEIEMAEGRRPGKKEREQLKEDIRALLLPRAFTKSKRIPAWINTKRGLLVVNASSDKAADDFTAQLREAIGSLPIIPWGKTESSLDVLTSWYSSPELRPNSTEIDALIDMKMVQDPSVKANYRNLDLEAAEIAASLEAGMRIKTLGMSFDDQIHFVINETFAIKRIKYADKLVEQANESDDPRTDAALMMDTINNLVEAINGSISKEEI